MRQKLICGFLILMFAIVPLPNANAQTTAGEKKTTTKKTTTTLKKTIIPKKRTPPKKRSSESSSNINTTTNENSTTNKDTTTVSNPEQEALIQQAKTKLELAQRELERVKKLYSAGVASSTELNEAEARVKLAEQELKVITNGATNKQFRNRYGIEMVYIPPGEFMMGSPETEKEREEDEGPQHQVTIKDGFYMGRYEVTQAQYEAVMGVNPSGFKNCPQCPVERVSWNDAKEFIKKLNAKNDGFEYRLPSEAEWEYACRAGTTTAFSFGDSLSSSQANFNGNYPYGSASKGEYKQKTTPVGSYQANAWGLYDMHGNVWEWVEDIYNENGYVGVGYPTDGRANVSIGDLRTRVLRGGSWYVNGWLLRSADRHGSWVDDPVSDIVGFRIVASARTQ